jgi:hypothetical protein
VNIPWRSSRFDEEALTREVATRSRAQNALEQYRKRAGARTLAFCCSRLHADLMAEYFRAEGLRTVAVHSGERSAPRAASLEKLETGELDAIFAVDIFNEGLDVPQIDTVMMLRPTESRILWLQQFGRGLRRAEGKDRLTVIDYIGNHRSFLVKPQALFELGSAHVEISRALHLLRVGSADLPPGCEVTYELEAVDILKRLLREGKDRLETFYEEFRELHGVRPNAAEAFHEIRDLRPARKKHGSWFGFVKSMGGLDPREEAALDSYAAFLEALETTPMTKSYKMLVLLAMLGRDRFPGEITIGELTDGFGELARRSSRLREDIGPALDDAGTLRKLIESNPVAAWAGGRGTSGTPFFSYTGSVFRSELNEGNEGREELRRMVRELIDLRLAQYLQREEIVCKVSHAGGQPIIFLDRDKYPNAPEGWTNVSIDGEIYRANFVKIAVNVIRRVDADSNELPAIMRRWFGPDAGAPGTRHRVLFLRDRGRITMNPLRQAEVIP